MSSKSNISGDINLATGQIVALLQNMLDLTKTKRKELESIAGNITQVSLRNSTNFLIAIANTAGNSTANDLFIDTLNKLLRETYDKYPNAETMSDLILDAIEIYFIAIGKHYQGKEKLFDTALLKIISDLSFQRRPMSIIYDPYKMKQKGPKVIPYEDD